MKWNLVIYIVIIVIILALIITGGFLNLNNIIISSKQGNLYTGLGGYQRRSISPLNSIIALGIIISTLIITIISKNRLKSKWILFLIILVMVMFVPVGILESSGGVVGINIHKINILELLLCVI